LADFLWNLIGEILDVDEEKDLITLPNLAIITEKAVSTLFLIPC